MRAETLKQALQDAVVHTLEDGRDYLGMSQIGRCSRELYEQMVYGQRQPWGRWLWLCHEGYVHQADVLERLRQERVPVLNANRELVAGFDERFRGHIDGEVDGDLLEIKSVNDWAALREIVERGPRPRDRDQVQAYMRYGGYARALIVYKARQSGELWVCWESLDEERGAALERKAQAVLAAVDARQPPACDCGWCERGDRADEDD